MNWVRATAVRWIDVDGPPTVERIVEVHLHCSDGTIAVIVDKDVVFGLDGFALPCELTIPCDVLGRAEDQDGARTATVRLHHSLGDDETFRVSRHLLVTDD